MKKLTWELGKPWQGREWAQGVMCAACPPSFDLLMRPASREQARDVDIRAKWKLLGYIRQTDLQQRSQESSTVAWGIQVFPLGVPVTHRCGGSWGNRSPPGLPSPALQLPALIVSYLGSSYTFAMTYCTGQRGRNTNEPDLCKQHKPLSPGYCR